MTVSEAQKAAEVVTDRIAKHARIIWGCSIDQSIQSTVKILLIVTGARSEGVMGKESEAAEAPSQRRAAAASSRSYGRDDDSTIDFVR
jgi:cell division protein FtsZ